MGTLLCQALPEIGGPHPNYNLLCLELWLPVPRVFIHNMQDVAVGWERRSPTLRTCLLRAAGATETLTPKDVIGEELEAPNGFDGEEKNSRKSLPEVLGREEAGYGVCCSWLARAGLGEHPLSTAAKGWRAQGEEPAGVADFIFQKELFAARDTDSMHNLSAQPWQAKMANLTYDNFTLSNHSEVAIQPPTNYKTVELVFIATVTGSLSLVTVVGNILVMLSIKVNRQLQTVNNYFLFSLACADLIIGVFSMNLYTVYIIKGYWPLGAVVCDLWLALDYVVSNASVMNLLIISFDRYFCVTKPLTYPARRTTKMAGLMIAAAWILSFILWAPAILFWQFIVGKRTVRERECYIQFLSNPAVTFGTAIAAFYLPVVIMTVLYIHISLASRSRVRRHKPESRKERKGKSLSFFKGPLIKQNNNNSPKRAVEVKEEVRNGKVDDQPSAQTEATGHQEEKETSNESSTVSMTQTTKDRPTTEILPVGQGQSPSHPRVNPSSKWSKIKIVTKQTGTECVTAIEIVPAKAGASDHNSLANSRPANVARKFASIARSQVRKKRQMAAREKKVTRTIFAILLAFILTWTPYNVMVLINTFCETCVPETVWSIGYWLCYVNSTINPACYALCNATFKKTFKHLLMCQYRNIGTAR